MRTGIIYGYVNLETGKMYIGQTLHPERRWRYHRYCKNTTGWHKDYQKNPDKYEYSVIEYDIPEDKLNEREIFWIAFFNSYNNGYNLTPGGDGMPKGYKHTEETKKKLSESNKGKHLPEQTKRKMSEAHKGEKHPMYGKHRSEETKKKLRKPIIQYSKSGEFIKEWCSVKEAAEHLCKPSPNICMCLKGRYKYAYGYVWKYKNIF